MTISGMLGCLGLFMFYWAKPFSVGLVDQLFQLTSNQVVGASSVVASSLVPTAETVLSGFQ